MINDYTKDNPFRNNYIFSKKDIERYKIKWFEYPFLWLLPTYVQTNNGYAYFYKRWGGEIYIMGFEPLSDHE